jgi:hypothetical protein
VLPNNTSITKIHAKADLSSILEFYILTWPKVANGYGMTFHLKSACLHGILNLLFIAKVHFEVARVSKYPNTPTNHLRWYSPLCHHYQRCSCFLVFITSRCTNL